MRTHRFSRYSLRTIDVTAARAFYDELLGPELWTANISAFELHENAIARGARPHWLGHIGVNDVEAATKEFVALGAEQLGPSYLREDGSQHVHLRDPYGALVALSTLAEQDVDLTRVAWHILHAEDHERAFETYAQLFHWTVVDRMELSGGLGSLVVFGWDDAATPAAAGCIANTGRRNAPLSEAPHIHTQWLYFFRVDSIEDAIATLRKLGGRALPAIRTPQGALVTPCEDPQGAAFALFEDSPFAKLLDANSKVE